MMQIWETIRHLPAFGVHAAISAVLLMVAHSSASWQQWFYARGTGAAAKDCKVNQRPGDTFQDLEWKHDRSFLLFGVALTLLLLRRLSLWEHLKHWFRKTAPWGLEVYLLCWWALVLSIPYWGEWSTNPPTCFRWIALFAVIQVLQTNFYHEFWRTLGVDDEQKKGDETQKEKDHAQKGKDDRKVFNRMRNLIIAFMNVFFVNRLFGAFYWWSSRNSEGDANFVLMPQDIGDAFYFSVVTGSTLGYGEIRPALDADLIQRVVVFQIFASLFLVAVVLSMSVGAVKPLGQKPKKTVDEQKAKA